MPKGPEQSKSQLPDHGLANNSAYLTENLESPNQKDATTPARIKRRNVQSPEEPSFVIPTTGEVITGKPARILPLLDPEQRIKASSIAGELGVSRNTVRNWIDKLRDQGILIVGMQGNRDGMVVEWPKPQKKTE